jgi:DNA-binding HxlR family transcriptional regulator
METMLVGDSFNPACPTRVVLDRVGDRWSVLVILSLADGPLRFTQLRRRIGGVTAKVLTQTLRAMQRDGLLTREVFAEVPPRVEYTLTELGQSLQEPLLQLTTWAESNVNAVIAAREDHDSRIPA